MSTITSPGAARPTPPPASMPDLSRRDLVVDLARVCCVLLVVVIHVVMVGVGFADDGSLVVTRPAQEQSWFPLVTWAGQVMPLFFVVGGFASATAWASTRRRGGDAGDYIRGRLLRLARPASAVFVVLALALVVARAIGVDPGLLDAVAIGVGSPLWFVAAYGITQVCVPVMARLHATRPLATFAGLAIGAVLVDAVRYATGVTEVGLVNLLFVWLFVQQLGFAYASGWFRRPPRLVLVLVAALAYASLVPLTSIGPWPTDQLAGLNPPTVPLIVLGIAQICVLTLVHPLLSRLMETRGARAFVFVVGSRGMTVYLWHVPLLVALIGVMLLVGAPLPAPASSTWWWTRIPVTVVVLALVGLVSLGAARLERPPRTDAPGRRRPSGGVIAVAAVLVIGPSFAVMQHGLDVVNAIAGAVGMLAAIWLLGRSRPTRSV
ncbi:acyltransferase family protein [Frigoribacterium sp. 2-23]|uniref:acyltransferase family protein n=1 Tax=Frigoribacterium sp. 2-23 TaxID=3415006 RepID=UPI003C701EA8